MKAGIALSDCTGMRVGLANLISESPALHVRVESLVGDYGFRLLAHLFPLLALVKVWGYGLSCRFACQLDSAPFVGRFAC